MIHTTTSCSQPPTSSDPSRAEGPPAAGHTHLLGDIGSSATGPTLVVVAAIHGNEPSGLRAFEHVYQHLKRAAIPLSGRLVGYAGNLAALEEGQRFIEEDLNRIWSAERVAAIRDPGWLAPSVDAAQQAELLNELETTFAQANGPVFFLDLHTSSARGEPFVCIGDTLRNREFATTFPVPVILGLEEQVDGALLEHVNNLGHVTVGVEAGQHDHPDSIDHHEAFVWLALVSAGCIDPDLVPDRSRLRRRLADAVGDLPPVMEVRYRHAISADHGFVMRPGYANFQHVEAGDLLARDISGEIHAHESGRVLLPLYQGLGNDGFFVVREVRTLWLTLSAALRRLGLGRFVHWLPGVRRGQAGESLIVDRRVARWFTVEIFHLLGFRKERTSAGSLVFSRRRERY